MYHISESNNIILIINHAKKIIRTMYNESLNQKTIWYNNRTQTLLLLKLKN